MNSNSRPERRTSWSAADRATRLAGRRKSLHYKAGLLSAVVVVVGIAVFATVASGNTSHTTSGQNLAPASTPSSTSARAGQPAGKNTRHKRSSASTTIPQPSTHSDGGTAARSAFNGDPCSLVGPDTATRVIARPVVAARSTDGSNSCEYRDGAAVLASIQIDRGITGGPANATDLNRLVSGISGPHADVPNLGERAVLLGTQQSSVLFVLASGWTMQVVASNSTAEEQLARAATTRL
jgi:hypothetical protein